MAHILQNILPQYVPVFRTEIIEPDFDDADLELLDIEHQFVVVNDMLEAA